MTTTAQAPATHAEKIIGEAYKKILQWVVYWEKFIARWAPKNELPSFRFECAYCGDDSNAFLTDVEFIDSGTQLKCESCQRPTIIGLFTVVEYGRACNVLGDKR